MKKYYDGYDEAIRNVGGMNEVDLLNQIDALQGRKYLPENYTFNELRHEAIRQTQLDWLDSTHPDYWFYKKLLEQQS